MAQKGLQTKVFLRLPPKRSTLRQVLVPAQEGLQQRQRSFRLGCRNHVPSPMHRHKLEGGCMTLLRGHIEVGAESSSLAQDLPWHPISASQRRITQVPHELLCCRGGTNGIIVTRVDHDLQGAVLYQVYPVLAS